jgi:hypothetical protein
MSGDTEALPVAMKRKVVLGFMSAFGLIVWWGWGNMTEAATLRVENATMGQQVEVCADIQKQAVKLIVKLRETP